MIFANALGQKQASAAPLPDVTVGVVNRVIGYANFHRTEGTHEPVMAGWLYDHSPVMTARWRAFLETKYGTIDKLQAAWNDKNLTGFAAVPVPTDPLRGATPVVAKQFYWQEAKSNQRLRDYLELQRDHLCAPPAGPGCSPK
jgi:hypothetical protein